MFEERPTRAAIRQFHRPFYRRWIFWLSLLTLLLIIARLSLDPLATSQTRKALNDLDGFDGTFSDVQVGVIPPHYGISQLKIIEKPGGQLKQPLLYAEQIDLNVDGGQFLRGRLAAAMRIESPKVTIVQRETAKDEEPKKITKPLPDLAAQLQEAPPLLVTRIEIKDGEVLYRDPTTKETPEFWIHRIEVAVENIATREERAGGRPTVVTARAVLQRSGEVTSFLSMEPFAKTLTFAGRTQVRGLALADMHGFLVADAELKAPKGTFDLFAEYRAEGGLLSGGIKPVFKNVEIEPTKVSIGDRMKIWLADKTLDVFSDRVPGRNGVATTIPMRGKLTDPDIQLLPTVLGVIRNAFVEGLASGFANLPPRTSGSEEGTLKQVKDAPTGNEPPEAQPR